jgi:hypothetical protein
MKFCDTLDAFPFFPSSFFLPFATLLMESAIISGLLYNIEAFDADYAETAAGAWINPPESHLAAVDFQIQ